MNYARHFQNPLRFFVILLILSSTLLASCSSSSSRTSASTSTPKPKSSPTANPTPSLPPTATPAPGKVILVGQQEATLAAVQALLGELASKSGLSVETLPAVQVSDITPGWKVVVFLSVPGNLPELLSAAPSTQFVVLSPVDIQPAQNLNVVRTRRDTEAFMAGYLSALVATDSRTAGLLPSDSAIGGMISDAFRNGQFYYCGTCSTYYAPFARFPLVKVLPSATSPADWQAGMDEMMKSYVYAVYVAPEATSPELLRYLLSLNIPILGSQTPPDEIRTRWASTIRSDEVSPLRDLWPDLVVGKGGKVVNTNLQITDVNPQFLTPGRQMRAEAVMKELLAGLINPISPPLE